METHYVTIHATLDADNDADAFEQVSYVMDQAGIFGSWAIEVEVEEEED